VCLGLWDRLPEPRTATEPSTTVLTLAAQPTGGGRSDAPLRCAPTGSDPQATTFLAGHDGAATPVRQSRAGEQQSSLPLDGSPRPGNPPIQPMTEVPGREPSILRQLATPFPTPSVKRAPQASTGVCAATPMCASGPCPSSASTTHIMQVVRGYAEAIFRRQG